MVLKIKKAKSQVMVEVLPLPAMGEARESQPGDQRQQIRKSEKTQTPTEGCPQVKAQISKKSKDIVKPSKVKGG